jgi:4-hydroxybenzoate polyprenyltransferase
MISYKSKKYLISAVNIIAAVSAGLCILMGFRDPWSMIILLCATATSIYLSKSISKEEREKQDEISTKAFIAGILIPIGLILLLLIAVVVRAIWKTYI